MFYKKSILSILVFTLSFTIGYKVLSWTGPTGTAPAGNAPAPINVSSTAQTKEGNLSAAIFYDANDPSYYVNPSGNSKLSGSLSVGPLIITGAASYLKFPLLTTAQRDALTPETGMTIYNTTLDELEVYVPSKWQQVAGGLSVGQSCTELGQCATNFCVDGYCCDSACNTEVCQTCGTLSLSGAGHCDYVTSGDPDNECAQGTTSSDGCSSDNCSGSGYACVYQTSGDGGCPNCYTCSGATSIACAYHSSGAVDACTGAYICSGFTIRLRNTCDGSGACADVDAAATDCSGTCASYCSGGSCISTDTSAGTCTVSTNARVASGGNGHCTGGTCVSDWSCGQSITDSRDSKVYATVLIGTQCWFKQGLNVGTRIAGADNQGTSCSSIQKYCYADTDANCDSNNNPNYPDGGLYQWNQAMCGSTTPGVQGICPTGWHIPTDAELCTLEQAVDSSITCDSTGWRGTDGGTKLKPGGSSGFEGNLAGYRYSTGSFVSRASYGGFWSSSQYSGTEAWRRYLYSDYATVHRYYYNNAGGFSVRCLKD